MLSSLAESMLITRKRLVLDLQTQGIWLLTGLAPFTFLDGKYAFDLSEPLFTKVVFKFLDIVQDRGLIQNIKERVSTKTHLIQVIIHTYLTAVAAEGFAFEAAVGWTLCLFDGCRISELPFLDQTLLPENVKSAIFKCE